MLNCQQVTERASDFLDGTLSWRVRVQVRLHLLMCRFCREYVRQMSLVVGTLRRLPGPAPTADLQRDLLTAFRAGRQ
jgi:hypothetical protein